MAPAVIGEEYYPGKGIQTDNQILEYIKNNVMTLWHAACTCKMGTSDDEMAVVDSQARVYGVEGVRVVDASAFPFLPPGHPQSTVCEFYILDLMAWTMANELQICWRRRYPILLLIDRIDSAVMGVRWAYQFPDYN